MENVIKKEIDLIEYETKYLNSESEKNSLHNNEDTEITEEQRLDTNEPNFQSVLTCDICEKSFNIVSKIKDHYEQEHNHQGSSSQEENQNKNEDLKCEQCDKIFGSKHRKKIHFKTHILKYLKMTFSRPPYIN